MVPARNLLRRHYDTYGGGCFDVDSSHLAKQSHPLRSNLMLMAEHQPSTTGDPAQQQITADQEQQQQEQEAAAAAAAELEAAGTSNIARADDSWLQLGIGLGAPSSSSSSSAPSRPSVELELFSDRPSSSSTSSLPTVSSYRPTGPLPTPPVFSSMGYRPPPWGFWSSNLMQYGTAGGSSSSSTPPPTMMMMPPTQFYNVQRFPLPPPVEAAAAVGSGGPGFGEMRVVSPPAAAATAARQQHTGVWFLLRAAENQVREPFLPQIPKSYIRIKDGRMTVRLLMKYLVKKLGLDDESEVQISCRGQPLPHFLTLQHVRDDIWCPSEAVAFLPDSPSTDHVMTLQYGRSP